MILWAEITVHLWNVRLGQYAQSELDFVDTFFRSSHHGNRVLYDSEKIRGFRTEAMFTETRYTSAVSP